MQATKEKPNSNGHVSPVIAAVLDCFQSPPTRAYRDPHPAHPGNNRLAESLLNGETIPHASQTPAPTNPTILTPRYAEDVIDPSRSAPAREFVGNELHNTPTSSSPREEAGNQGRTAAPALAHWSERCTIVQRSSNGRTTGFDVISPSGKHWLLADARAWGETWPNMTLGAHQTVDAACRAVAIAPSPPDAFSPVTSTVYVARPKDAGAMSRQETIVRQARENNCTEKAADEKHMSAKERVLRSEPSHYCGATGHEALMREAEFLRGRLSEAVEMHTLALGTQNIDVLRERMARVMRHREHLFTELNNRLKSPALAVVAA